MIFFAKPFVEKHSERMGMISKSHTMVSIKQQCELLCIVVQDTILNP
jgi:hypothetical protein